MADTLYNIVIRPLEYLIEVIFVLMHGFLGRPGYALIALSIAVSTLTLPLYARAEAVQEKEREQQKKMEAWLAHIRKAFRGDERYMMQQAYYAEQGYKPLYALKGTMTLLLQVPFFVAAYHFLSHLHTLQGCAFGPIRDLGAGDGLLQLGGWQINLLPVLMTVINVVSGLIYTKGFSAKEKIQPFALALVFLVLLYHSPAGLVVYWTMNNIYSLIKNIVMKYAKHPGRVLPAAAAVLSLCFVVFLFYKGTISKAVQTRQWEELFCYAVVAVLLWLPFFGMFFSKKEIQEENKKETQKETQKETNQPKDKMVWLVPAELLLLSVLLGLVLPLFVISSYPADFVALERAVSPLHYAAFTMSVSAGVFLFWGGIIWILADEAGRENYQKILCAVVLICLMNAFCFHAVVGTVSTFLRFDYVPKYPPIIRGLNLLLIGLIIGGVCMFWKKLRRWMGRAVLVALFSLVTISGYEYYKTVTQLAGIELPPETDTETHYIPLSTKGKNVIVIMLDRAIGAYIPFLFDEKPELEQQFAGFTFYPNTVSYGRWTLYGAPALFGGYDYTPEKINERAEERLADKHDEALRVMPVMFGREGYRITAADLPLVHYEEMLDTTFLDDYVEADVFELAEEGLTLYASEEYRQVKERNFFFYSLYKITPAFLQDEVYDSGDYLTSNKRSFMKDPLFLRSLLALRKLKEISRVTEEEVNTFFMMDNNTTHQPTILPLPDYDIDQMTGNENYDLLAEKEVNGVTLHFDEKNVEFSVGHYHANMAAMLALGEWFDRMRSWGVYDNTRIIIVSDHGSELKQFDNLITPGGSDLESINALLMFKDFGASEFTTDHTFMTNGDVPALATGGVLEDVTNPFTGNPVNMDGKKNGADIIWVPHYEVGLNQEANVFLPEDAPWYHIEKDIFDHDNWNRIR